MALVTLRFMGYGVSQETLQDTVDLSATLAVIGSGTTVDATVDSSAVTQLQARMTALGFVQVAANAQPECSMVQQTVVPSVAGYLRYNIPLGLVFRDGDVTLLEVDTGAGFTPLVYGVDYVHLERGYVNLQLGNPQYAPPVSVRDAVIG